MVELNSLPLSNSAGRVLRRPDHYGPHLTIAYASRAFLIWFEANQLRSLELRTTDLSLSLDRISSRHSHIVPEYQTWLEQFTNTTVILGCVAIASSRIASAEESATRLEAALAHIDRDRLMVAPDCGLMMLGRDLTMTKLRLMCEAARSV